MTRSVPQSSSINRRGSRRGRLSRIAGGVSHYFDREGSGKERVGSGELGEGRVTVV